MNEPDRRRLHATIGVLAHRAGWAAYDTAAHEAARSLFRLALYTAVTAGDHDLRAHVLADVAAQHNQLGYHQDALEIIRLGEGDERVAPAVRMILHGAKARTYAAIGEADACRRHVDLAGNAYTQASPDQRGWVATLCHPGLRYATTGHAIAQLARHTGMEADRKDASQRLTQAIDTLDPTTHTRTRVLCTTRLAMLHLAAGDLDQTATAVRQALHSAADVQSARLGRELAELRAAAAAHPDTEGTRELIAGIDGATPAGPGDPTPAAAP